MNKLSRLKQLFIVLLLFFSIAAAAADIKKDEVDRLFSQWDRRDTPGCALAIIKDGKIVYKRGYGSANLEYAMPITPQSVFYVGSVSKQFVAMSIALLAKQEKISLDDNIRRHVPELPDYGTPITVLNLIHHTSGLRDYLALLGIAGLDFGSFHEEDVLELIVRQKELNFKPGEEYLYSNSGYFLLGLIVKRASGKTLREFAQENIFKPLGMKNSHFHDDYTQLIKNRAWGYFPGGRSGYKNFLSTFDCVGSGGLYTTVEDLFLWDQNFYHCRVGGKELIELMETPGKLGNGKKLDYAFALVVGSYKGLKTISHGGALGGFRAHLVRFPEQSFSVICLSNLSTFNPARLSFQIADIYLAGVFREELKKEEKVKFIKLPEEKLKEKAGIYVHPESGEMMSVIFDKKEQRLVCSVSAQSFPLAAVSETEFKALDAPLRFLIKFEREADNPFLIKLFAEDEEPKTYQFVELVKPRPEQLEEYQGEYFSKELQVTFRLALLEGKLYLIRKNAPRTLLQPAPKDIFSAPGLSLRFVRDEEDKISSFTLNAGRIRNLRFIKK